MKTNLLEFLYGVSQQEAEIDDVLSDDFSKLLEQADSEEAESLKAEKAPLSAALKSLGISSEALHEEPAGYALITDDRETYLNACAKLADAEAMHALAKKGWVATHCGDQAMSNEVPEYKIRFLDIATTTGDGTDNSNAAEGDEKLLKKAREFATTEPEHDEDLNPVDHSAPEGNKLAKVKIGKAKDGAAPEKAVNDSQDAGAIVSSLLEVYPFTGSINTCECDNPSCGNCGGHCRRPARMNLVGAHEDDGHGVMFCRECGNSALQSGSYRQNVGNFIRGRDAEPARFGECATTPATLKAPAAGAKPKHAFKKQSKKK